jgi:hypothetical protein
MDFLFRLTCAHGWAEIHFSYDNFSRIYPVEYCLGDNLVELLGGFVALSGYRKKYKTVDEIIEQYLDKDDKFEWIASCGSTHAKFIIYPVDNSNFVNLKIIEYFYTDEDDNEKEKCVFEKNVILDELIDSLLSSCNELLQKYGIVGYYENYWVEFPILFFLLLKNYRKKKFDYNMIVEKIDGKDEDMHKTDIQIEIDYINSEK